MDPGFQPISCFTQVVHGLSQELQDFLHDEEQ